MSIAVSVNVRASKILCAIQYGLYFMLLMVAGMIYFMPDIDAGLRYTLASACSFAALLSVLRLTLQKRQYRIVVSDGGQIYLTCQFRDAHNADAQLVRIADGSTIWSSFMLLRLRTDEGKIYSLALTTDSMSVGNFRALAVAVRYIIHRNRAEKK